MSGPKLILKIVDCGDSVSDLGATYELSTQRKLKNINSVLLLLFEITPSGCNNNIFFHVKLFYLKIVCFLILFIALNVNRLSQLLTNCTNVT